MANDPVGQVTSRIAAGVTALRQALAEAPPRGGPAADASEPRRPAEDERRLIADGRAYDPHAPRGSYLNILV